MSLMTGQKIGLNLPWFLKEAFDDEILIELKHRKLKKWEQNQYAQMQSREP